MSDYSDTQKKSLVDSCPTKVFTYNELTGTIAINNANNCIFCKECLFTSEEFKKFPEDRLAIDVKHSPDTFYFTVETNGALTPVEVIKDSFRILHDKLKTIKVAAMNVQR